MKTRQIIPEKIPTAATMSFTPVRGGLLQRKTRNSQLAIRNKSSVPRVVHEALRSFGQPLDGGTRDFMETRFGHDFSQVRVHTDPRAEESARAVGAVAYTVGNDIAFDTGRYAPATQQGQYLLAHELTHVAQQNGQPASRIAELSMTEPGDAHELEANTVAAAVIGGSSVPSRSASGMILARQGDAGVATPVKAPVVPPATATKAPVAPSSAAFGKVAFDARADRIPPTKTVDVPVTLTSIPPGSSVTIDVEGSGGANGTATLTVGASLAASGAVTVKGGTQTAPGNAGKLNLRAKLGATVIGRSAGFTIAAWPIDFTTSRVNDIDTASVVGVAAANAWLSDSGSLPDLDEVKRTERVDIGSRDNPPFTSGSGTSATAGTSGFISGTASPTTDRHSYGRTSIDTSTVTPGGYTLVYRQNFLFNDRRTGTTGAVVTNSGFTITHTAVVLDFPIVGRLSSHKVVKTGAAVSVEGKAATAGSGTATSEIHTL